MSREGHLEETLRRILAETLATGIEDPRVGFVTVSEVRLNRDRTVAQMFYTVMGDEEERSRSLAGLKRARGYLRQAVAEQTRMRQVPEIRFRYDDSLDRSFRVEALLEQLSGTSDAASDAEPDLHSEDAGHEEDESA